MKKERWAEIGVWLLGLVFLVSAAGKLRDLGGFEALLMQQGLTDSRLLAAWAARLLTALELALGLACCQPHYRKRYALPAVLVVTALFSAYLAHLAVARPEITDCGCLGELLPMSPAHALLKNVILLIIGGFAYAGLPRLENSRARVPALLGALALGLVFVVAPLPWRAPEPAETGLANPGSRFAVFREFRRTMRVDLTDGVQVVAFFSTDCEHCLETASRLGAADAEAPLPPIHVVFFGDEGGAATFLELSGTDFPYTLADAALFYEFIAGVPPHLYLLRDGEMVTHWSSGKFTVKKLRQEIDKL